MYGMHFLATSVIQLNPYHKVIATLYNPPPITLTSRSYTSGQTTHSPLGLNVWPVITVGSTSGFKENSLNCLQQHSSLMTI